MTVDTGAGYQPDGTGVGNDGTQNSQAKTNPQGGQTDQNQTPQDPNPQDQQTDKQGNPLTALFQERQGRREDLTALTTQLGAMQQQLNALQTQGGVEPERTPWKNPHDPQTHPVDYMQAEITHMGGRIDQAVEAAGQRMTDQEQKQALVDYERGVATEIQMAAAQVPELGEAYGFVVQQFGRAAQGSGLEGAALANQVRQSMLGAFLNGSQKGLSAPQVVAQLATNWGYRAGGQQQQNPGGGPPPVPGKVKGQQAASQSLGNAGTGGTTTPPNIEQLVKMPKAELMKNDKAGLERIKAMARGEIPLE